MRSMGGPMGGRRAESFWYPQMARRNTDGPEPMTVTWNRIGGDLGDIEIGRRQMPGSGGMGGLVGVAGLSPICDSAHLLSDWEGASTSDDWYKE